MTALLKKKKTMMMIIIIIISSIIIFSSRSGRVKSPVVSGGIEVNYCPLFSISSVSGSLL